MPKCTTADRLKQVMSERNLKQIDILNMAKPYCEKYNTRLGRNDLSQYVSGKVEPGQHKLYILGKALNVNEAWLMGYDVPSERIDFADISETNKEISELGRAVVSLSPEEEQERLLLIGFRQLDKSDRGIIIGEIRQMLRDDKYSDNEQTPIQEAVAKTIADEMNGAIKSSKKNV